MLGVRIPPPLPVPARARDGGIGNGGTEDDEIEADGIEVEKMAAITQWWPNARTFIREAVAEAKKVTWPDRKTVVSTTIVVIVATFIIGFYLALCDQVLGPGLKKIFDYFGA
jgi:preprotein translocase subunit SecE